MKVALYARVSTKDKEQNPELQLAALRKYCADNGWEIYREYTDEASASDFTGRKAWTALMKEAQLKKFNVLLVWKLDRAFRSVIYAVNSMQMLNSYNVGFKSYMDSGIDTTTPMGNFVFSIMTAAAELEQSTIRQRVNAGIAYAKENGTKSGKAIGRPRKSIDFTKVLEAFNRVEMNYTRAARLLTEQTGVKVTPGYVYNQIKRGG